MKISKLLLASPIIGIVYSLFALYFIPNAITGAVNLENVSGTISLLIVSKMLVYLIVALLFSAGIFIISRNKEKQSKVSMYTLWSIATTSILYMGVFGLLLIFVVGIFTYYQHGWKLTVGN